MVQACEGPVPRYCEWLTSTHVSTHVNVTECESKLRGTRVPHLTVGGFCGDIKGAISPFHKKLNFNHYYLKLRWPACMLRRFRPLWLYITCSMLTKGLFCFLIHKEQGFFLPFSDCCAQQHMCMHVSPREINFFSQCMQCMTPKKIIPILFPPPNFHCISPYFKSDVPFSS